MKGINKFLQETIEKYSPQYKIKLSTKLSKNLYNIKDDNNANIKIVNIKKDYVYENIHNKNLLEEFIKQIIEVI
jgi:hypothetical protein